MPDPTACPRTAGITCPHCHMPPSEDCPLADAPSWAVTAPIGSVAGTCDPDDGVCEACQ